MLKFEGDPDSAAISTNLVNLKKKSASSNDTINLGPRKHLENLPKKECCIQCIGQSHTRSTLQEKEPWIVFLISYSTNTHVTFSINLPYLVPYVMYV